MPTTSPRWRSNPTPKQIMKETMTNGMSRAWNLDYVRRMNRHRVDGFWDGRVRCTRARLRKGTLQVRELLSRKWVDIVGPCRDSYGREIL